jgi:hypothetical protein
MEDLSGWQFKWQRIKVTLNRRMLCGGGPNPPKIIGPMQALPANAIFCLPCRRRGKGISEGKIAKCLQSRQYRYIFAGGRG